jgi:hypothetical protein
MKHNAYHLLTGWTKRAWWPVMFSGFLALASCEEIMDISFSGDSGNNLVVEGSITTDTMQHLVLLSYTGDYFKIEDKVMATGATVSITDGTSIFPLTEKAEGAYYTAENVHGEPGKTYTLQIQLPDGRQFSASDYLSPCNPIDSITQSLNYNTYGSGYGYDVLFYAMEPEPSGDNYMYLLYIDDTLYSDTITEVTFVDDEFVNGNYVGELPVYRIREDDIKTAARKVTLEIYSVSRSYYEFMSALMVETIWRGSPWDGPPANIPGNVSNGATGFFRASDVNRKSKMFLPLPRAN